MAIYRTISLTFWTDAKITDDFTPEDKYFYLYLFTNPHTNLAGCYEVSVKQMANETGYNTDSIERLLRRFSEVHKVAYYCKDTKELLLVNWHKYNWTSSEKFRKPLSVEIQNLKCPEFKNYLTDVFNDVVKDFSLYGYGIENYGYGIGTKCIGTNCSDTSVTVTDTDNVTDNVTDIDNNKYIYNAKDNIPNYEHLIGDRDILSDSEEYINHIKANDKLYDAIHNWLLYKNDKGDTKLIYKEIGLKALLKTIVEYDKAYGTKAIESVITKTMAGGYKGIVWDFINDFPKVQDNSVGVVDEWV